MVRRRSTVRFRNGSPLKDQVRSSLGSSHPTLRMGAVAVLGGIWEIVSPGYPVGDRVCVRADRAGAVGPRGSAGRCRVPRREPEACRTAALGLAFNRGLARWPYGHEMMTWIVPDTVPLLGSPHAVPGLVSGTG